MTENSTLTSVFNALMIFPSPRSIERAIAELRQKHPGMSPQALARSLVTGTIWRLTGAGVVASLPGAIPGLGTAAQVAIEGTTLTAETWLILRNLTTLQLIVAGLHGHDPASLDRRDEVVVVWGLTTGAIVPAREATRRVGTKVAIKQFNKKVSGKLLAAINRKLGTTVFTKWGTKRGGIALGRLVPFGVGILVGGGMNYMTARAFSAQIVRYYSELLPCDAEVLVDCE